MLIQAKRLLIPKGYAYQPGLAGLLLNPFYLARKSLWQAVSEFAKNLTGELLDVGCGTKPYEHLFSVASYEGLDIDTETTRALNCADRLYDGKQFPYETETFDSVLCNQVLEHVFNPDQFVSELARVLAPGGRLLLTVPFIWDEHEQPYDYARYSTFGLRDLLERNGFVVQEQKKLLADASLFFQLINAYVYKVSQTRSVIFNALVTLFVMFPVNVFGLTMARLLPGNPDLFLDQIVLAEKRK